MADRRSRSTTTGPASICTRTQWIVVRAQVRHVPPSLPNFLPSFLTFAIVYAVVAWNLGGTNFGYPGYGCLPGGNDQQFTDYTLTQCQDKCVAESSCQSIDWYDGRGIPGGGTSAITCSLSSKTFAVVGSTTATADCRFYELYRNANSGDRSSPLPEGGECDSLRSNVTVYPLM